MKFRKKPIVVEAMEFTNKTKDRVLMFMGLVGYPILNSDGDTTLVIETLEGDMTAKIGDFIIKGVSGEFYPCKPDIFRATYDPVE